ncbi:MAG: type II secretion system F family protein [Betaproteobacteria bacterium]|nr:type II secretion system F family protein [Betaproteobacteria bacterium]
MPFFAYKARNAQGELVQGTLEGNDSSSIAALLINTAMTPIDIKPTAAPGISLTDNWWRILTEEKVTQLDVQMFSRQLYTLLKAGVPIMRGLVGLQESATNKTFARVIQDLRESLDAGRELSAAMSRHPKVFSPFYLSMIRVGEMTGRLDNIFLRLFDHLEFEREMGNRVRSALRYPMFVVIAMAVAITVINLFVIPAFAKVYAGFHAKLPVMTQILINSSSFMVHYWLLLLVGLIGSGVGFKFYIATASGRYRWDKLRLHFPIVGKIVIKGTLARFARSFALSSKSGIPIIQSLSVVAQTVDNAYIANRIEQMRNAIERGESILRASAATNVFTPVVLQMIAVGEETGDLDGLMEEIAEMYEREVDYELKTLSSQIEPILILGLGALVLVLALGVFLPIWNLGQVALHK